MDKWFDMAFLRKFTKLYLTVLVCLQVALVAWSDAGTAVQTYRDISAGTWSLAICTILGVVVLVYVTNKLPGLWFGLYYRSPGKLESAQTVADESPPVRMNFTFLPADIKWLGPVFLVTLLLALPNFARWEEIVFRTDTKTVYDLLVGSLCFGMVHMIVGVPFAAGLCISFAGVVFGVTYMIDGLEASSALHTAYNAILVFLMLCLKVATTFRQKLKVEAVSSPV